MQDREVVAAIVAGDPAGLAAAYDRYAAVLQAYCRGFLHEPADAADAVQDTFVIAASKLAGLRDPDRLRPWLYAVARNECHRRLRTRAVSVQLDEADDVSDQSAAVGDDIERAELRELVHAALIGLNPGDREVIELSLCHDLASDELAAALGVPLNHAHAVLSRARGQLERSLGALLVARTGREECADLDALLAGWDGRLNVLLRKRVNRHIENCEVCGERRRRELRPALLLGFAPVVMLLPGQRADLLRLVGDTSPEAVAHRARIAQRAEPFDQAGFPIPLGPPDDRGIGRRRIGLAAVALVLIVLLGAGAAVARFGLATSPTATLSLSKSAQSSASLSPSPSSFSPSPSPIVVTSSSTPSLSPSPTPSLTVAARIATAPGTSGVAVPTTGPATVPASAKTTAPSVRPTTPSPSPTPYLTASPTKVTLTIPTSVVAAFPAYGSFTLTATDGTVTGITITSHVSALTVKSGYPSQLAAGESPTIDLTWAPPPSPGATLATLTIEPGNITVTVIY
jgi:RNA polymerase sigma factor (sigma-70 family)